MVKYLQKTNRNSFSTRFKKYKKLRADLWGRLAFLNRNNKITKLLQMYASRDVRNRTRGFSRRKKNKIINVFFKKRRWKPFEYSVEERPKLRTKRAYSSRSNLKFMLQRMRFFYNLRSRRKSISKLLSMRSRMKSSTEGAVPLETRIDVLLYRINMSSTIFESRRYLNKVHIMGPRKKNKYKFFSRIAVHRPHFQVPLFSFITFHPLFAIKRRIYLVNRLFSFRLVHSIPKWIFADYAKMLFLIINHPLGNKIRYPFSCISYNKAVGSAIYYI